MTRQINPPQLRQAAASAHDSSVADDIWAELCLLHAVQDPQRQLPVPTFQAAGDGRVAAGEVKRQPRKLRARQGRFPPRLRRVRRAGWHDRRQVSEARGGSAYWENSLEAKARHLPKSS